MKKVSIKRRALLAAAAVAIMLAGCDGTPEKAGEDS